MQDIACNIFRDIVSRDNFVHAFVSRNFASFFIFISTHGLIPIVLCFSQPSDFWCVLLRFALKVKSSCAPYYFLKLYCCIFDKLTILSFGSDSL